jgi:CRISPR-associated endonuclease Cas2
MIVIAYDIRDEKRLRKIAKLMQSYAIRIQLSVFLLPKATKNDDGKWADIASIPFNSNDYSVAHPTINVQGTKMYFASDK